MDLFQFNVNLFYFIPHTRFLVMNVLRVGLDPWIWGNVMTTKLIMLNLFAVLINIFRNCVLTLCIILFYFIQFYLAFFLNIWVIHTHITYSFGQLKVVMTSWIHEVNDWIYFNLIWIYFILHPTHMIFFGDIIVLGVGLDPWIWGECHDPQKKSCWISLLY